MHPIRVLEAETIGAVWLAVAEGILTSGADAHYDGAPTKELAGVTVVVASPDPDDALIVALGEPEWSDWMRRNFTEPDPVRELGDTAGSPPTLSAALRRSRPSSR